MSNFKSIQSSLQRSVDSIRSRVSPKWAERKIDSHLFLPNSQLSNNLQLPKDFEQVTFNTPDGDVNLYQTGEGPTIVFVHGWNRAAPQFFSLMRGLKECGFKVLAFDHLGHGKSAIIPGTIKQMISTTNNILQYVKSNHPDGLYAVVGHGTGCMVIANGEPASINDLPLFLISPVFNYKQYFLKKLKGLPLHSGILDKYAAKFIKNYDNEYGELELSVNLQKYHKRAVIVHDRVDDLSPISDTVKFCAKFPLRKLVVTKKWGHDLVINSESVWQELKSILSYETTVVNFSDSASGQSPKSAAA